MRPSLLAPEHGGAGGSLLWTARMPWSLVGRAEPPSGMMNAFRRPQGHPRHPVPPSRPERSQVRSRPGPKAGNRPAHTGRAAITRSRPPARRPLHLRCATSGNYQLPGCSKGELTGRFPGPIANLDREWRWAVRKSGKARSRCGAGNEPWQNPPGMARYPGPRRPAARAQGHAGPPARHQPGEVGTLPPMAPASPGVRGALAQLAEQRTFNPSVQGSIPWRPTSPLAGQARLNELDGQRDHRLNRIAA